MTLAISADASDFDSGWVLLTISGATGALPVGAASYTSNFSAGYDSWTGGADSGSAPSTGYYLAGVPAMLPGYVSVISCDWSTAEQYMTRTVSGLTIGNVYKFEFQAKVAYGPTSVLMSAGISGIGASDLVSVTKTAYTTVSYTFTATATSHALRIRRSAGTAAAIAIRSASLQRLSTAVASEGVTIIRYDGNGSQFVRQVEGAAPDSTGYLEVYDWEAAFYNVTYLVRDASGSLASTAEIDPFTTPSPNPEPVCIVAVGYNQAYYLSRVDEFERAYEYRESANQLAIIGRQDPVVNTRADNVWTKRQGTVTYYATGEAEVESILAIYRASRVTMLKTGVASIDDMYHVATSIDVRATTLTDDGWRYQVVVEYQEINWPEGPQQGSDAWTYDDITNGSYLAYFELKSDFATYADLKAGP